MCVGVCDAYCLELASMRASVLVYVCVGLYLCVCMGAGTGVSVHFNVRVGIVQRSVISNKIRLLGNEKSSILSTSAGSSTC